MIPRAGNVIIPRGGTMSLRHLLAALALGVAGFTQAAPYPTRPVTIVVPFPAGGSSDMIGRVLAQKMGEKLGGTFIVENKPGATGSIGAAFVKIAPPDG